MSDAAQGPGWWQASDGRWYPPESHPSAAPGWSPPAPGATTPGRSAPSWSPPVGSAPVGSSSGWSQPAPGWSPPAPAASAGDAPGGSPAPGLGGARKVLIALALLLVVGIGGCAVAGGALLSSRARDLTGGGACPFLSPAEASALVPGRPTTMELSGVTSLVGLALDQRVLARAPSCLVTPSDGGAGPIARVARVAASDARRRFADELTVARGVTEDRGNGLSVESEPYLLRTIEAGDEAFCTTAGLPPASGALVRRGDVLVYVSLSPPARDVEAGGAAAAEAFADDEGRCALARRIAEVVLAR